MRKSDWLDGWTGETGSGAREGRLKIDESESESVSDGPGPDPDNWTVGDAEFCNIFIQVFLDNDRLTVDFAFDSKLVPPYPLSYIL